MREPRVKCPRCGKTVDRVDGEYGRHRAGKDLCPAAKREISAHGADKR